MERRAAPIQTMNRISSMLDDVDPDRGTRGALPLLDEEVSRLPDRLRGPIVLCYFQGKTYTEAAVELSVSEDTVRGRLARGRDLLRGRLARRGVGVTAGVLATMLTCDSASAVPATLVHSTCAAATKLATGGMAGAASIASPTAVALSKKVIASLIIAHAKPVAVVLAGVMLVGGGGIALRHAYGDSSNRDSVNQMSQPAAPPATPQTTARGNNSASASPAGGGGTPVTLASSKAPIPTPARDRAVATELPVMDPLQQIPREFGGVNEGWIAASVQSVRPGERSLTVIPDAAGQLSQPQPQSRQYTIGDGVPIEVTGKPATFAKLQSGQRIYISINGGRVVKVRASTPRGAGTDSTQ
jgi:hypothetical protein